MTQTLTDAPAELERVLVWRFERLFAAGYTNGQAVDLAAAPDVDLHDAIELVARGCPPHVAVAILV